jgi:hypothetical protein
MMRKGEGGAMILKMVVVTFGVLWAVVALLAFLHWKKERF